MQFGSESECGATLGATQVKTFQYSCPDFSDSNSRRNYATWVWFRMRCDTWCDSCTDFPDPMSRLSRLKQSARLCNLCLDPDAVRPQRLVMSLRHRPGRGMSPLLYAFISGISKMYCSEVSNERFTVIISSLFFICIKSFKFFHNWQKCFKY